MSSTKKTKIFLNNKRLVSNSSTKDSYNKNQILNKGPWSDKEDQLLKNWVDKHGPYNWTKCSEYIKGRSGKQCREHWNNSLDPNLLKGQWTSEEDLLIMIFYKKYDGSWKKIIPIFKKRTENSIKNRFFSQLRKIVSKNQQNGKKEYSTKFGLDVLKQYLPTATEIAKKKFFEEKKMNEKEFDEYVNKIDNMVKNRKKGNKFIDLKIIKENKKYSNIIDINEEKDNYENEANLETAAKKKKRRGRKKLEQNKNKDESYAKEETVNKEELLTHEDTMNPINSNIDQDEELNNNINNNNVNKIFKSQRSKNKNESLKEEKIKNDNDIFKIPNSVNRDNKNNLNNNYFDKKFNEEKKAKKYNQYTIDKNNINEDDADSNGSMAEVDKQIQELEKETIKNRQKYTKNYKGGITSKNVEYNMKKGTNISPCMSFEYEVKESNANTYNRNNRISRRNSINRDIRNFNKQLSFGYNFSKKKSSEFPIQWYELPTPSNIDLSK